MKMQEVIVRLREHAPVVESCTRGALRGFDSLHEVIGAAMRAGMGCGVYASAADAVDKTRVCRGQATLVRCARSPRPEYERGYRIFTSLYPSLRDAFHI